MRPQRRAARHRLASFAWLAAPVMAGAALAACEVRRERPDDGGQHPPGWTEPASASFHGRWLSETGYDLDACRACHGADYAGGAVGVSCNGGGCHERGVESCGTCHGKGTSARPATGAHDQHASLCGECHQVPVNIRAKGHMNGTVEVAFSGLAVAHGAEPVWSAATGGCAGTYCHVDASPRWKKPAGPAECADCHGNPPASHVRWSHVAAPSSCAACHPVPPDPRHVNGVTELVGSTSGTPMLACDTCHGQGPLGAPPAALDGSTDPATRGVGAHRRHLDETLEDRIGKVASCGACHSVPSSVDAPGHLDTSAPADVVLAGGGAYDASTGSCVVGCHWDRSPGPSWTDTTGAARACDACHGFPPAFGRDGTPHTPSPPSLDACEGCHVFNPSTHVDGHVDLVQ